MLQKDPNLRATIEFIKMDEWLNKNDEEDNKSTKGTTEELPEFLEKKIKSA